MFCIKCGADMAPEDQFCPECGSPRPKISDFLPETDAGQQALDKKGSTKINTALTVIITLLAVVCLGTGGFAVYKGYQYRQAKKDAAVENERKAAGVNQEKLASNEVKKIEQGREAEADETAEDGYSQDQEAADKYLAQFSIDPETIPDYSKVLEPQQYAAYEGEDNFYFSYPKNLYNNVEVSETETENTFGVNRISIQFTAADQASTLLFQVYKRNDSMSISEKAGKLYEAEYNTLYGAETILNKTNEPDYGRFIITGYTAADKAVPVYYVVAVEAEYIKVMRLEYPEADTEEDKEHKWYYVECIYRMCGFSGRSYFPRTFEQYKNGDQGTAI